MFIFKFIYTCMHVCLSMYIYIDVGWAHKHILSHTQHMRETKRERERDHMTPWTPLPAMIWDICVCVRQRETLIHPSSSSHTCNYRHKSNRWDHDLTATCCNTLQHAATHCNTLPNTTENATAGIQATDEITISQCVAVCCSMLQSVAVRGRTLPYFFCRVLQCVAARSRSHSNMLQNTATSCRKLQDTTGHCNMLHYDATCCSTLQHVATHSPSSKKDLKATCYNTLHLQHTAAHYNHCNTLQQTCCHRSTISRRHGATHCNCNTLQDAAACCNTL